MAKTIVSITPVAVGADSRAYRIAASFRRFGYRSVVVEGGRSTLNRNVIPFELISLASNFVDTEATSPLSDWRRSLRHSLRSMADQYASTAVGGFLFGFWWCRNQIKYLIRNWWKIPKADLYYVHCYEYFPLARLFSKTLGSPIFYDAHDFYSEITSAEDMLPFDRQWLVPFKRRCERRCLRQADYSVTVCDGLAAEFEEAFGQRPYVLRNLHDKRLDRPLTEKIRDVLKLHRDVFLVLTIGTAKEGQAIEACISAAKNLPNKVHFAFLGKGYQVHSEKVKSASLESRFHFLNPVLPSDVVPFATGADAALLLYYSRSLNYRFALPNGFFQGVACGLPTLYPNLPEIRQIAERYKLGLMIDAQNPQSIANSVLELVNKPKLREALSRGAKEATLKLSWEGEEIFLRNLIEKVIIN